MKLFVFKKIRNRLSVWFLLLILIPLLTVLTITYFNQASIIQAEAFSKLIAIRDLKVIELKNWLSERISDLTTISVDEELTDLEFVINKTFLNKNDSLILQNSRQILTRYLNNYPAYYELFIIDPINSRILVSTNKNLEGLDRTKDDYFTKTMLSKEVSIKDVYYSTTLLENTIAFSIPIFCSEHFGEHIVGILVARIDLENSLYKMLGNRVGLGTTGETLIVDEDAVALNELRWHEDAPLKLQISAVPALNAAAGKTGIEVTGDYRNRNVLAAYTYIPETKWGFICKQDTEEVFAPINKILLNYIALFAITIIIASIIVFVLGKSISKPIVELNSVAQKIVSGDLSARNISTAKDEMGALSMVFNTMADSIESRMKTQQEVNNISATMIKQTTLQEFSTDLLKHMMKITGTSTSIFYILNEATVEYEHFVAFGMNKDLLKPVSNATIEDEFKNALTEKKIFLLSDISRETELRYKSASYGAIPREIITIPILVDNLTIALISIVNVNKFNAGSVDVLKQSWHSINASYSNLLSNERTRILAESLVRTNEQLEHQTEKLQEQSNKLIMRSNELKQVNDELESFAYSVSHDLRAPLRHVDGFTKLLHKNIGDNISETSQKYFDNIISSSKRMSKLIEDLLIFSRTSRKDVKKSNVKMKSIVNEAIQQFGSEINKRNIVVNVDEMPHIKADTSLIMQVWTNLISNSIKFTSNNNTPEIHIGYEKDKNNNIVYFIKDNGAGFDQKYADKLFGVFQRLHTADEFHGTGIGLANVQRIIIKHGGKVWAKGRIGKGASFFFTLP